MSGTLGYSVIGRDGSSVAGRVGRSGGGRVNCGGMEGMLDGITGKDGRPLSV
jgi:hypothetical protein